MGRTQAAVFFLLGQAIKPGMEMVKRNGIVQNEMKLETTLTSPARLQKHATVSGVLEGLQAWTKRLGHTLNLAEEHRESEMTVAVARTYKCPCVL